jgi:hypothetical protein
MKKNFMVILYLGHGKVFFLCRESNPRNLFGDGKEFWGDNGTDFKYCFF